MVGNEQPKSKPSLVQEFPVMSLLTGENVPSVIEEIARRFPQGSRIMLRNLGRFEKALRLEKTVFLRPLNNMAQTLPVSFAKGTGEEEGGLARFIGFRLFGGSFGLILRNFER